MQSHEYLFKKFVRQITRIVELNKICQNIICSRFRSVDGNIMFLKQKLRLNDLQSFILMYKQTSEKFIRNLTLYGVQHTSKRKRNVRKTCGRIIYRRSIHYRMTHKFKWNI